ncbi:hypothetical protein RD110_17755 [Rhodoferax koreense]|uniref:YNCE-like beta-propeller domain-containing protein n=1 Tax=Rhodoferax koreensis TaxID=1842727 RepID=A0A1P8JYK3_9BURK|nr:hypothetical protein RD110_17755 [Rhodoferax koreense]
MAALVLAGLIGPAQAAGPKAYVGNFKDNTVSVLDIAGGTVLSTLPVSAGPDGLVAAPGGGPVFVSGSSASTVDVIDSASDTLARKVEVGQGPQGLALTPDGKYVLVAVNGEDRVAWIDVASRLVAATLAVPKPHTIAIHPDGGVAYVASQAPGHFALVAIDLRSREVTGHVALDKPPRDLEFSADGKALYVTLAGVAAVQEVDTGQNRIVAQIPTGISPHLAQHFARMPFGVVVVQGPGEVQLFDPASRQPLRSVKVGQQPHWMDRGEEDNQLLVSNEGSDSVSIVDLASGQTRTVAVGHAPRKIAVQHAGAHVSSHEVSIANFAFQPAQITVAPGQRVTWTNRDGAPHGVAFADRSPGQDLLLPGKSFSRVFDAPGVYDYACSVHPYMTGKVVVRAPSGS